MRPSDDNILRAGFYWQTTLHQWEADVATGKLTYQEAMARLEYDWVNVLKVIGKCEIGYETDPRKAMLLSKLAGVAGTLQHHRSTVQEQIRWRDLAYRASRTAELVNDELGHGLQLAYLHFLTGALGQAEALLDQLEERNDSCRDSPGDAKLNGREYWERSEAEVQRIRAGILSHRGTFLIAQGRESEALAPLDEALGTLRAEGDPNALASCLNSKAVALAGTGRLREAVQALDDVLACGPREAAATACVNRASYLLKLGDRNGAYEGLLNGERLAESTGDKAALALERAHLGFWYAGHADAAERSKAYAYLTEACDKYRELGDRWQLRNLLRILIGLLESVTTNEDASNEQRSEAWMRLAEIHDELGDYAEMLTASERFLALNETDLGGRLDAAIRKGHSLHMLKRHEEAIAQLLQARDQLRELEKERGAKALQKAALELMMSQGQAHRQLGQLDAAKACYIEALAVCCIPDYLVRFFLITLDNWSDFRTIWNPLGFQQ